MSQPHADVPPELLAEVEAALAVEVDREARAVAITVELADVDAAYTPTTSRGPSPLLAAFAWVLILAALAALVLVVRVVVAPPEHLDGTVLVPVLLIAAVVLTVAHCAERGL